MYGAKMTESSDKKSIWLEAMKSQLPSELHCSLIMSELGPWFSHPFCVLPLSQAHPLEQGAASILDTIAMKREAFRDLLNRRKWEQALFVVERPYRADALAELIEERGVRSLLSAIRYVWSDTESVFSNWQTWEYIWAQAEKTKRGKRRENLIYVMDKPERAFFAALPDKFIV